MQLERWKRRARLERCPIGLFTTWQGELCLKTEYRTAQGAIYIVSSGEFFWGDAPQSVENQLRQMVWPVKVIR